MTTTKAIWFSTDGRQERDFTDYDAAMTWLETNVAPLVNGSTVPNLPENLFDHDAETFDGYPYSGGAYWGPNRYAAVVAL